jgi:hypothetical protein
LQALEVVDKMKAAGFQPKPEVRHTEYAFSSGSTSASTTDLRTAACGLPQEAERGGCGEGAGMTECFVCFALVVMVAFLQLVVEMMQRGLRVPSFAEMLIPIKQEPCEAALPVCRLFTAHLTLSVDPLKELIRSRPICLSASL